MDKNILKEISQDKGFIQKLLSQDTDEGFKNILSEKNINLSLEDAKEIREQVISALSGNMNLTDEELEVINGCKGSSVGDAIIYTVKTAVTAALIVGTVKFGIDVADNIQDKIDHPVRAGVRGATGLGRDKSTYRRAVDWTADALMGIAGGKGEESKHTKDIKRLTGQEEKSEEIVKGFGLKNGKLF